MSLLMKSMNETLTYVLLCLISQCLRLSVNETLMCVLWCLTSQCLRLSVNETLTCVLWCLTSQCLRLSVNETLMCVLLCLTSQCLCLSVSVKCDSVQYFFYFTVIFSFLLCWPGSRTRCQMNLEILTASIVLNGFWKQSSLAATSVTSALEVIFLTRCAI